MIKLDATTRKIQVVLSDAVTTNQLPCTVSYSDDDGTTYVGGTQLTNTNDTTAVDICAAPGASTVRDIDYLSIRNRDIAAATVTVILDDNATDYEIVKATLASGDQLVYTHSDGWKAINSAGQVKSSASGGTSYTDEEAQDAVGTILADSATIDLTYSDAMPSISGAVINQMSEPGGRLTLSSATPVMTSDVSNSTSIYYTPYKHDKVPLYDGSNWSMTTFTEITNTTTDNTKNPAAVGADSNYDLFVWSDSGTIRLGRGPAWTSATARGTGAGTTELERINGIWVNKIAITNGPAAQRGTYVGTVRSDASSTIDWELGGTGAGGDAIFLNVWNTYNQKYVVAETKDSTDSWVYTTVSWRAANNSTLMRASFVVGLPNEFVSAIFNGIAVASNSWVGVCLDATNTHTGRTGTFQTTAFAMCSSGAYDGPVSIGSHYISAVELGGTTSTFYGDSGTPTIVQAGFSFKGCF